MTPSIPKLNNYGGFMPVITITHLPGTLGEELAKRLSLKLGIPVYERVDMANLFLQDIATDYDLKLLDESPKNYQRNAKNGITFRDNILHGLNQLADKSNAIILGTVPALFLAQHPNTVHIHVTAPKDLRARRLAKTKKYNKEEIAQLMNSSDKNFKRYGKILFDEESKDPFLYHITINTGKVSVDAAVLMATELYNDSLAREYLYDSDSENRKIQHRQEESTLMKNPSEIAFAKVLDMYHIRWIYEPTTFELEQNSDGMVASAFSPDFYLPDYDIYLELTVMNPRYSTDKKRKIRRIKELYPDINIKLVQKKDFDHFIRSLNRASTVLLSHNDKKKFKDKIDEDLKRAEGISNEF